MHEPITVLAGGPNAERDVSINSATAVHAALIEAGFDATLHTIDRPTADQLRPIVEGTTVFPALHGPWGEGGPLQDLLETLNAPYVGSRPTPARLAMDKLATKLAAASAGLKTAPAAIFNPADPVPPLPYPFIVKPTHEGSSVGLHICRTQDDFAAASAAINPATPHLIERLITGREITIALLYDGSTHLRPLPPVEIIPAAGIYDYAAKYQRSDTQYVPSPPLPTGLAQALADDALALAKTLGLRHLARVDFIVTDTADRYLLEANTMPGFTAQSLLPMAANAAGLSLPDLCSTLIAAARTAAAPA
ncbi:MAG: D-alanine--D-alanine ligase [Planctomycetota bacterium]